MRIGLITGEYPPMEGGVGAFTRELAVAIAQRGHAVHLCTDPRAQGSSEPGVQVSCTIAQWDLRAVPAIQRWARTYQLEVVNLQYEPAAYRMSAVVNLLPDLLSKPPFRFVTTFHDLLVPYLFPLAGPLRYRAVRHLAGRSDAVIVTNRADGIKLKAELPFDHTLAEIPIGSNIPVALPADYDRAAWRSRLGCSPSAFVIGYFGFMNATKGLEILLRAFATLLQSGLDTYLLLIGGRTGSSDSANTATADRIDSLIDALQIADHVCFTGFVTSEAVSAHLTASDVIALPYNDGVSYRRGSFMAALAHGCAIVTTTPEIALPELDNVVELVSPESPDALYTAIKALAENPNRCTILGSQAKALAARFSWASIAERTLTLYQESLK
jgi:glycosyltransferase involved in cell wall biosynthesis